MGKKIKLGILLYFPFLMTMVLIKKKIASLTLPKNNDII